MADNTPALSQRKDNTPMRGTIYLVDVSGDGYSHTNDRRMADALISTGMYKQVGIEEYNRVKALVDAESGAIEGDE